MTNKIIQNYSDKAVAVKTAARMLSSNTVPYVRHVLYVAKCEAVTAGGLTVDFENTNFNENNNQVL